MRRVAVSAGIVLALFVASAAVAQGPIQCPTGGNLSGPATITASIAAIDQPFMLNRYGAAMPQGQIFALTSDLVARDSSKPIGVGNVKLRTNKRPRPLVLRVRQGDCLQLTLTNYLTSNAIFGTHEPVTTAVSFHANGLEVVKSINDDGTLAGNTTSPGGLVTPGNSITYTLYAPQAGTFLAYSTAAMAGGCGSNCGGQLTTGLFGAVTVEPPGAEMYRSQITAADLAYASTGKTTTLGQPLLNYTARYPATYQPPAGASAPKACWPVLAMVAPAATVQNGQCVAPSSAPLVTYYTDLTALITGPNQGNFTADAPEFNPVPATPNRRLPFREFTIVYHEVLTAVQAFTDYYVDNPTTGTSHVTLGAGGDSFAINYGTGGIGTEILANRINVGFTAGSGQSACVECKFEEFFLSSWAVGDPAMVVDIPANAAKTDVPDPINGMSTTTQAMLKCALDTTACGSVPAPLTGRKATQAYFPDDPSNVYHSYLNDHVIFRIMHAGANFSHVHHQHAHQWLHTPNNVDGSYLDSQLLSPGGAFTLEMVYGGSGNKNKTIGDSIFHCHFYPHFAAGMWSLWRVHDVLETGTQLTNGRPAAGARALPDGEIASGTPIPAIVPLPAYAMPPLPGASVSIARVCSSATPNCTDANAAGFQATVTGTGNPGYPFFIPGVAGHRPPRPPLDIACNDPTDLTTCYDGGLQRHVLLNGTVTNQQQNTWDFSKDNTGSVQPGFKPPAGLPTGCAQGCLEAVALPETGTPVELNAIRFFGQRSYDSFTPTGVPGQYFTNGLPRKSAPYLNGAQPGAPFADPAVDLDGTAIGKMRRYKAAVVETDLVFNKSGWHYPQQRFVALWDDVASAMKGGDSSYTPQPLFFRANSTDDFIELWHLNLVPSYYELDDYQVRTPTDILGQHIHLVKFDVTSSDGAANGFNYEDGTLSPDEVRDRINAIRNWNGCTASSPVSFQCPQAKAPPITAPAGQNWNGAQVTVQRWYPDRLEGCVDGRIPNCDQTKDRTIRTVFTHDHFGPSTHQQVGLYAGLLVEPPSSTWTEPTTGVTLGSNQGRPSQDGGPTSWQAIIDSPQQPAFREFALEFQDLAHAYQPTSIPAAVPYTPYPQGPISPTAKPFGWADCANAINGKSGSGTGCTTAPNLIDSGQGIGTMLVNYRNEPLPLRVAAGSGGAANATDLSFVYSSIKRNTPALNSQPAAGTCVNPSSKPPCFNFPPPLPGAGPTDPYTPILQAYQGDNVQVRLLVGAHFFNHNFEMQGLSWLFEPSNSVSGWRDNQSMGISEHFENLITVPYTGAATTPPSSGLTFADYLYKAGAGANDQVQGNWGLLRAYTTFGDPLRLMKNLLPLPNNLFGGQPSAVGSAVCPPGAPQRSYNVAAVNATNPITYYSHGGTTIQHLTPLLYVPADAAGKPTGPTCTDGTKCGPIVLRAAAGECITVTLFNAFDPTAKVFSTGDGNYTTFGYPAPSLFPSTNVGMHAQLVSTNAARFNGVNVGGNLAQYGATTAAPQSKVTYQWYAGKVGYTANGMTGTPIEFGSANLIASDPFEHQPHAMIGALVIEPQNSVWCNTAKTVCSGALGSATVAPVYDITADVYGSSGALQFREFVGMIQDNVYLSGSNFNAINFGTEPFASRLSLPSNTDFNQLQMANTFSNSLAIGGSPAGDPDTPIFTVTAGTPVRFRMFHPDGVGGFPDNVFTLHGHVWQEEPYQNDARGNASALLGDNPTSQWFGARDGFGSGHRFDLLLDSAGGSFAVPGDYLYQSMPVQEGSLGVWGIFRVTPKSGGYAAGSTTTPQAQPVTPPADRDAPDVAPDERFLRPRDRKPPATGQSGATTPGETKTPTQQ